MREKPHAWPLEHLTHLVRSYFSATARSPGVMERDTAMFLFMSCDGQLVNKGRALKTKFKTVDK